MPPACAPSPSAPRSSTARSSDEGAVSAKVTKAPVNDVVLVGTKERPKPAPAPTPTSTSGSGGTSGSSGAGLNLARSDMWDRVAQCESGGNWSINTGNGYYGGLQFSTARGSPTTVTTSHSAPTSPRVRSRSRSRTGSTPTTASRSGAARADPPTATDCTARALDHDTGRGPFAWAVVHPPVQRSQSRCRMPLGPVLVECALRDRGRTCSRGVDRTAQPVRHRRSHRVRP